MQFEHFSAIAVKANALLLCVKIIQQDMDKFLMRKVYPLTKIAKGKVTPSPQVTGGAYGIPPQVLKLQLAARERKREEAIEHAASEGARQSSLPPGDRTYGDECRFFHFVSEIKRETHYLHHKHKPKHSRPLPPLTAPTPSQSEADMFDSAIRELSGQSGSHSSQPSETPQPLATGPSLSDLDTTLVKPSTPDDDTDDKTEDKDSRKTLLRRQRYTQSPVQIRQAELARQGLSPNHVAVTVESQLPPAQPSADSPLHTTGVAQREATSTPLKDKETAPSLRNYLTVLNILCVIQKFTKNKKDRVRLLVQFKAHSVFRTLLRVDNEAIQVYTLKVLKSMLTYLPRKWRNSNMPVVTGIYLRLGSTLQDQWTTTDPDLQPPPATLQQAAEITEQIARFNRYHYQDEDTYSEVTGSLWATLEVDDFVDKITERLHSRLRENGDDVWNNTTGIVEEWEFESWLRREGVYLSRGGCDLQI